MPSLADIAAAQPTFQTFQESLKAQILTHVKGSSSAYSFANEKRLPQAWNSLNRSKRANFNVGQLENCRNCYPIPAVATLEPKYLVHHENGHLGYNDSEDKLSNYEDLEPAFDLSSSNAQIQSSNEEIDVVDEREKLRRMRISKANKGSTPWNKGRKHSPEIRQRIKERTKLAMQDPKVKMKLTTNGHAQSDQTRVKIGAGVRMGWQRRREKLIIQELCLFKWQNSVAEASRRGYDGEEELQWDSYCVSKEKLKEEWVDCVERIKRSPRQSADRTAPKSAEQRRKISEAIAAKWTDSLYRERVCSALHKYHGTPARAERRPRKKPSESARPSPKSPKRKVVCYGEDSSVNGVKLQSHSLKAMRSKAPKFKDPLAGTKLEMIKNIRAQRTTAETQKIEAIGRARLLIAEAEKAANALEVAAISSPIARASLLETRKLIAEANQSIESIEIGPRRISSPANNSSSAASNEVPEKEPSLEPVHQNESDRHRQVNGIWLLESNDLSKLDFPDVQNYEDGFVRDSNIVRTSQLSYASQTKQHNSTSHHGQLDPSEKLPVNEAEILHSGVGANFKSISGAKHWVRGRLVEAEGSE